MAIQWTVSGLWKAVGFPTSHMVHKALHHITHWTHRCLPNFFEKTNQSQSDGPTSSRRGPFISLCVTCLPPLPANLNTISAQRLYIDYAPGDFILTGFVNMNCVTQRRTNSDPADGSTTKSKTSISNGFTYRCSVKKWYGLNWEENLFFKRKW